MVQHALMTKDELRDALAKLPQVPFAVTPTPLEECTRLSEALGGPRIFIKRDDLTGLAFGGNKARHMEFRIGDALAKGCDVYVNTNAWTSNNARMLAAACAKVGMKYVLVVRGGKGKPIQGNLLLVHLLGAEVHYLENDERGEATQYYRQLADQLRSQGYTPYVGPDEPIGQFAGTLGYLGLTMELAQQLEEVGVGSIKVYMVSGASMTGLLLGAKLLGLPWDVTGIYEGGREEVEALSVNFSRECQKLLDLPTHIEPGEARILFDYVGEGYAIPSAECIEAMRLVAKTEAIILDPNYTAKAMAGLVDSIRKGILGAQDTVVFIHTGGTPELFSYAESILR